MILSIINYAKKFFNINNRINVLFAFFIILFSFLIKRLFFLQIIEGEKYRENLTQNVVRELSIEAPRGNIYDRFGKPLAENSFVFSVKIDTSMSLSSKELNLSILNLIKLLEENNEEYIDELPITKKEPFEFIFIGKNKDKQKEIWKKSLGLDKDSYKNFTAKEFIDILIKKMNLEEISNNISYEYARKIIGIRTKLYTQRYLSYNPTTIAINVGLSTVTKIEEEQEKFKSIFIDTQSLRYYPDGKYFSHLIGYTSNISESDNVKELLKKGYKKNDIIGKSGLEKAFESNLKGKSGKKSVIVNNTGRRIEEFTDNKVDPIPGDKIILSLDKDLQIASFNILENTLKEILINKLTMSTGKEKNITVPLFLSSLVKSNTLSSKKIFENEDSYISNKIKKYVLNIDSNANVDNLENRQHVNSIIANGILNNNINPYDILLIMYEQGIITGNEVFFNNLKNRKISPLQIIINKIKENEITPQMANLDPSTGSAIVVDVKTGDVLASVSYPTYDNNKLVNNLNRDYYVKLLFEDPTKPLINRPFLELRPPGSTFKMISAIAALESGVINANSLITDKHIFTKAGNPAPKCWSNLGHGSLNIIHAIEVSCNYFFFEAAYRMGNVKNGTKFKSISMLNKYMTAFGLNNRSGVEIGEAFDNFKSPSNISSPALKEFKYKNLKNQSSSWSDGDTIRTAIGQAFNNYTIANMVKYISSIATKGELYDLHFLRSIISKNNTIKYIPKCIPINVEINDSTWNAIHEGMFLVTHGSRGTARSIFSNFPIKIAGKTGTAQENLKRKDHTTFAAFAPYDDPQIAIYVLIPFGATSTTKAPAAKIGREIIKYYFKLDNCPQIPPDINSIIK